MPGLIQHLVERPRIGFLVGLPFAALFLWLAVRSYGELRVFERGPTDLSVEEAIAAARTEEAYVRLPVSAIDCRRAVIDDSESPPHIYAPLRTGSGAYVAFATESGHACLAPPEGIVGVLERTNSELATELRDHLPDGAPAFNLCTHCGPEKWNLGLYLGGGLALASLLVPPLALLAKRRRERSPRTA